ncbi:MAG: amidohydrolase family protein [Nanoarchaeota archaeon]
MYQFYRYNLDASSSKIFEEIFENLVIVDSHVHIGRDLDKHVINTKQLVKNMDYARVNKAICFPLNNPNYSLSFTKPNDTIYQAYKKYPERIIPFCRLNPRYSDWKKELELRVSQGFKGIKLHPRSQRFRINSSEVKKIILQAQDNNLIILFHTGFGVKYLAEDLLNIIHKFPKVKFILGHSAFPDIHKVIKNMNNQDNVVFETSTLRTFDIFDLLKNVSYKKIIFGSDIPYYDQVLSLEVLIHTALILKKTSNQIKEILGANIIRWLK